MSLENILSYIDQTQSQSVTDLKAFLRIPSVSADPAAAHAMQQCAQYLADQFNSLNFDATVHQTAGHPIVVAKSPRIPNAPTALIYGHYDVQPPDPIDRWVTPPFDPAVRNNAIYARGAADDKGQIWAHYQAVRAHFHVNQKLPLNLTFLLEGEEEIDSHHLAGFIESHQELLAADLAIISDTNQLGPNRPAITNGLRGLVYTEVIVHNSPNDLHSGIYGGAVANPAIALCTAIAQLHDDSGRVLVDHFYDDVLKPSDQELAGWRDLNFDDRAWAAQAQIRSLAGEANHTTLERRWSRPTLDVNGLTSGYQLPGQKTIIPARASAKISMRLVANQDPQKIQTDFEATFRRLIPPDLHVEFIRHSSATPTLVPIDNPYMQAAQNALATGFGVRPVFLREGLTIPAVNLLKRALNLDTLLIGFGLPDDNPHAPNEKFDLTALHHGTRTAASLYSFLAEPQLHQS